MLAGISPEEMNELAAFELLEPDPLGRLAAILKLGFAALCLSSKVTPEMFEPPSRLPPELAADGPEKPIGPRQQRQILGI